MEKRDKMSSLFGIFLAVFICFESLRMPMGVGTWRDPGPSFFPFGAGVLMGVLCLILQVQSRLAKAPEAKGSWYSKEGMKKSGLILVILLGYAFSLDLLGFLIATGLLLFLLFKVVEPQKWIVALSGSILASLASYILFNWGLKVQLPKGLLGF